MREHNNLPATFNYRIHAFSFDYGLVALIVLINIFMQFGTEYDQYIRMALSLIGWYVVLIGPSFFSKGITLGRKNSKIRLATEEYNEIDIKTVHARQLFILLATLLSGGVYVFVAYYFMQKRIDKRAIHDLIFNTRVIRTDPFVGLSE